MMRKIIWGAHTDIAVSIERINKKVLYESILFLYNSERVKLLNKLKKVEVWV